MRRLNPFVLDAEVEDLMQEMLPHLCGLSSNSKHRLLGKNDIVQTFDPIKRYGVNERRFRHYMNTILLNKFLSLRSKRLTNPFYAWVRFPPAPSIKTYIWPRAAWCGDCCLQLSLH